MGRSGVESGPEVPANRLWYPQQRSGTRNGAPRGPDRPRAPQAGPTPIAQFDQTPIAQSASRSFVNGLDVPAIDFGVGLVLGKQPETASDHASQQAASWLHLPVLVAVTTGMRRGELLGLRWCDIDFKAARLTVNQSLEG
jgi:hypothetical protein